MAWLMLEGFTEKIDGLVASGVPAMPAAITAPKEATGIAFPETEKERVLRLLGITSDQDWTEAETSQSGVNILMAKKISEVYIQNRENAEKCRGHLKELAAQFGIDISLFVPHKVTHDRTGKEGELHIFIWSTPRSSDDTKILQAFGAELLGGTKDALEPCGSGKVIRDQDGVAVAEVFPWNIYILFDATHHEDGHKLVAKVLELALPEALPANWNEKIKKYRLAQEKRRAAEEAEKKREFERAKERYREQYVKACCSRLDNEVESRKRTAQKLRKKIDELTKALVEASNNLEICQAELAGLQNGDDSGREKFAKEFDNLFDNPAVERVEVDDGVVKIYTADMLVDYNGYCYNFGKFSIEISVNGQLHIYSLRYGRGDKERVVHPHLVQGSAGCQGNISTEVAKLVARHEFSIVAQLIIGLLQSYNSGNPYRQIDVWDDHRERIKR